MYVSVDDTTVAEGWSHENGQGGNESESGMNIDINIGLPSGDGHVTGKEVAEVKKGTVKRLPNEVWIKTFENLRMDRHYDLVSMWTKLRRISKVRFSWPTARSSPKIFTQVAKDTIESMFLSSILPETSLRLIDIHRKCLFIAFFSLS